MAEGVAVGGQVAAGVYDDPDAPPPPDAVAAPKGWTWQRSSSSWQPALRRARGLGAPAGTAGAAGAAAAGEPAAAPADVSRETPGGAGPDPAPAWAGNAGDVSRETPGGAGPGPVAYDDVPAEVKDDITGLVGLVAMPILSLWTAVDPYCGAVATEVLDPGMQAALPLICRSSKIVAYFADESNDWLLWGKLAIALKPLGVAVVEHHILGRVRVIRDPQTGLATIERGPRNAVQADPLQPHVQPDPYQYAA